ncbi:putative Retinoic acid inducible protein [Naja naja]|nr:putative Retinoic acid inducible protein [Naja naja]
MTEDQRENLLRFKDYIVKILNPAYILSHMKNWLSDEYTGLYQAIEIWDFKTIESLKPHRELLKRIEPSIQEIDVTHLHGNMKDCLLHQEWEEIHQISHNKGRRASASKLVECLRRSDKEHWPKMFQNALYEAGYDIQVKLWDLKGDDNADVEMESEDESSGVFQIQISEEAESDNLCGNSCSALDTFQQTKYLPKKARSYQIELAEPAVNGKHTMICAPTGSGKTFVSIMICEHHLSHRPAGQTGKVVFLATKVPVYEQQKRVFQEHFKTEYDLNYNIAGICGENSSLAPADIVIQKNDIIVMTPQTLLNCLNNNRTTISLSTFTLMIFDECHNTTGSNPYNMLMFKYLDLKLKQGTSSLPQIVGLTASPGIGNAKNVDEAIDYICKICASLNIEVISTVRKNLLDGLSVLKNQCYGTQKYEQWIVDVQKRAVVLQLTNMEEESRKYNDALIINEDARTKDALDYLKDYFEDIKNDNFDDIEKQLASNFEVNLQELTAASEDESNENPKLEDIKEILGEAYYVNSETRTILFVKTRALLTALKNWIEETPELQFLKPQVLMGRGKRNHCTGMTLPNQKGTLDAFKINGDSKLLIATSVADEGIDIVQCNLRYRAGMKRYKRVAKAANTNARLQEKPTEPKPWKDNLVLLCGRCKIKACSTEDLRVIEESHHTVLGEKFKTLYTTKPHKKARNYGNFEKKFKMYCIDCGHDWGIIVKYKTFEDMPIIKIESFSVQDVVSNTQNHFRKWKDVDFAMKDFDFEEIFY